MHNEKETNHTDSTLFGYINMPMVNTIYGYHSELNHMECSIPCVLKLDLNCERSSSKGYKIMSSSKITLAYSDLGGWDLELGSTINF